MRVLVQHIDRYQEDTPTIHFLDIPGAGKMTLAIAGQAIIQAYDGDLKEDDEDYYEFLNGLGNLSKEELEEVEHSKSKDSVCLWGEESDIIVTKISD